MIDNKNITLIDALNVLNELSPALTYEKICELLPEQKKHYCNLLKDFKLFNEIKINSSNNHTNLRKQKGDALEKLVNYLLQISGGIFKYEKNVKTGTNEIDQIITLSPKGKLLCSYGIINPKLSKFLGECKNYNKRIDVTYVGKFCSLLLTNNIKLGILFSYYGVSGSGWKDACGLIRKFYLHKENINERFCIIDFNLNDFESILDGNNLLQIIEDKLNTLQYDTDYTRYLPKCDN